MKVVEYFAGVGGFRVGLERYDKNYFETIFFNQWEPSRKQQFAYDCYVHNFGLDSVPEELRQYTNYDVRQIPKEQLPNFDLLVGGFPCQNYSVAGPKSSKGIEGDKGVLWWDIRSTLEAKNPNFVLLENVDRLLKSPAKQRGKDFGIILKCFDELDYCVEWCVINAAEYNEPQKRRRIFIFAYKNNININKPFFDEFGNPIGKERTTNIKNIDISTISNNFVFDFGKYGTLKNGTIWTCDALAHPIIENTNTLRTILLHTEDEKYYKFNYEKMKELKGAKKKERTTAEGYTYTFSEGSCPFPDNLDVPARTMLTSEGSMNRSTHIVEDQGRLRILQPIECERIQTFDDNWTKFGVDVNGNEYELSDTQRRFLMGNALVTNLITKFAPRLKEINEGLQ